MELAGRRKTTYSFTLADGRHVHGHDFLHGQWAWRDHPWEPWVRYVRLPAKSPTYGDVTVVIVDGPGQDRFYLLCLETTLSGPQLIRRWRRRQLDRVCLSGAETPVGDGIGSGAQ